MEKDDDVRHFDDVFTKMDPFGSYTHKPNPNENRKVSMDMWSDFSMDPEDQEEL